MPHVQELLTMFENIYWELEFESVWFIKKSRRCDGFFPVSSRWIFNWLYGLHLYFQFQPLASCVRALTSYCLFCMYVHVHT